MDGIILAAGLGTRMLPLTAHKPKALVEVCGTTLLEHCIGRYVSIGIDHIVVNMHYCWPKLKSFVEGRDWGVPVTLSDESALLLDTGGGLRQALSFCRSESVLVHNVDVMTGFDLQAMVERHNESGAMATLAVSERASSRQLLFTGGRLSGWLNRNTGERLGSEQCGPDTVERAFSGVAVVRRELLALLPDCKGAFPIIPEYIRISNNHVISSFEHDSSSWIDVGKPEAVAVAEEMYMNGLLK